MYQFKSRIRYSETDETGRLSVPGIIKMCIRDRFRKTGHNVLYVLLIGTVLNSFFGSVQSALTRIMDPNEYDSLLADLVASFANVNSEIMVIAALVLDVYKRQAVRWAL